LIYKRGNAGVTRAAVTIIFDNSNKKVSPEELKHFDKIVISRTVTEGKSKYVLNGRAETADKVKSMFMGMNLNVNNPHFLVMQGMIAKVI
jgi:structural maintenance of chromosome 2